MDKEFEPLLKGYRPNELHPELLSTTALTPWPGKISSSRIQMLGSQTTQALYTDANSPRRCVTGIEDKLADYTFGVRMPKDSRVLKVIHRYPNRAGMGITKENPESIIIYEYDVDTENRRPVKEVDYISLPSHHTLHQNFGFRYNYVNPIQDYMPEGYVIAQSPTIDSEGNYNFGFEANVVLGSIPEVHEDGVVASESMCERMRTTGVQSYAFSWGKKAYPLNLYGDEDNYQPFPNVGDYVRDDGIISALRSHNENISPVAMSKYALQLPDANYDDCIFTESGAKVVDVRVYHDTRVDGAIRGKSPNTPIGMEKQPEQYYRALKDYYETIKKTYQGLYAQRKDALRITPKLHRLLVESYAWTEGGQKDRMIRTYRGVPIDEWRVEITVEFPIVPTIGYKVTGMSGDKGVIVSVWPDDRMPVDQDGNRADFIMDGISTIKRMNPSRLDERYLNAASRDLTKEICNRVSNNDIQGAKERLRRYYEICSPRMLKGLCDDSGNITDDHLQYVKENGITLWIPTDNEPESMDIIRNVRNEFRPLKKPIWITDEHGNKKLTKKPISIGSMYMLLLEKTGRDWAGVSSAKLNLFGIPSKLTANDRNSYPVRIQPIRFGESEIRLFASTVGGAATSNLLDRTNNPVKRKVVCENIVRSNKPTNINKIIDRKKYPTGQGRIHSLINHYTRFAGYLFVREKIKS